jgi:hypothetical protein
MFLLLCILAVLAITGLAMLIYAFAAAPEAIEDDRGFHFLNPEPVVSRIPEPFSLTAGDVLFFK